MATATRKNSRATAVNPEIIGQVSAFLQELPEKQKEELSLREAVGQMQEQIRAALAKGYKYEEIAKMLSDKGIKISALTLKNYAPSGKRQATKTKAKRAQKSDSSKSSLSKQSTTEVTSSQESPELSDTATKSTPTRLRPRRAQTKSGRSPKTAAAKSKSGNETRVRSSRTRKS